MFLLQEKIIFFLLVIQSKSKVLKLFLISGESLEELNGYGTYRPRNIISSILGGTPSKAKHLWISNPQDFRQVKYIYYHSETM